MSEDHASRSNSSGSTLLIVAIVGAVLFVMLFGCGILAALLLPAVQKVRSAANEMKNANNLKTIGIAMHVYHGEKNTFPTRAIYGKDGEPLLSWRVAILPYLDQAALHARFRLDEPWDSPHNKALLAEMPDVYRLPTATNDGTGMTHYQVVVGKGTMFEELQKDRGIGIPAVVDGTAGTILVVEAANAVPWTKPEDLNFDPNGPVIAVGPGGKNTFQVLMADGSVRRLKVNVARPDEFRTQLNRLLQRNEGEVVDMSILE